MSGMFFEKRARPEGGRFLRDQLGREGARFYGDAAARYETEKVAEGPDEDPLPTGLHRSAKEQPEALETGGERFHSSDPSFTPTPAGFRHGVNEGGSLKMTAGASPQMGKHADDLGGKALNYTADKAENALNMFGSKVLPLWGTKTDHRNVARNIDSQNRDGQRAGKQVGLVYGGPTRNGNEADLRGENFGATPPKTRIPPTTTIPKVQPLPSRVTTEPGMPKKAAPRFLGTVFAKRAGDAFDSGLSGPPAPPASATEPKKRSLLAPGEIDYRVGLRQRPANTLHPKEDFGEHFAPKTPRRQNKPLVVQDAPGVSGRMEAWGGGKVGIIPHETRGMPKTSTVRDLLDKEAIDWDQAQRKGEELAGKAKDLGGKAVDYISNNGGKALDYIADKGGKALHSVSDYAEREAGPAVDKLVEKGVANPGTAALMLLGGGLMGGRALRGVARGVAGGARGIFGRRAAAIKPGGGLVDRLSAAARHVVGG